VLVGVVDGLKGFPEAIKAVFPQATVQTPCLRGARFALSKPPEKCEACPSNHPESGECRPKRILHVSEETATNAHARSLCAPSREQ
jgi:hypothetical protein